MKAIEDQVDDVMANSPYAVHRESRYRTRELVGTLWWPEFHQTLDDAIVRINGVKQAELIEVEELAPGARVLVTLAVVLDGEWYINDKRRLDMAKVKVAVKKAGRNVADDLIGGPTKKATPKAAAPKAAPKAAAKKSGGGTRTTYTDDQKIKVIKSPEFKDGSKNAVVLALLKKSPTVGAYRKLRKQKLDDDKLGGIFGQFIRDGVIKVS